MLSNTISWRLFGCAMTFLFLGLLTAHAATEKVLYSFNGTTGAEPFGLTADALGNLYGASTATTAQKYGSVYRLSRGPAGHWNMTVLYVFKGLLDGKYPNAKLVVDSAGNLYGTTVYEGSIRDCSCGTVFELSPTASGPWKETTLYSFQGGKDGAEPFAGLTWAINYLTPPRGRVMIARAGVRLDTYPRLREAAIYGCYLFLLR